MEDGTVEGPELALCSPASKMSTLPTCIFAPHPGSHSWQDFSQQKVDPALFKEHEMGTDKLPPPHPPARCRQPGLRGLYVVPVKHQHPSLQLLVQRPLSQQPCSAPLGAHTGPLCLPPAQLRSEGRKMLTLCVVCVFNAFTFSSWVMLSLSYQMPLCSLRGAQAGARQQPLGGGCSPETRMR